MVKRVVLTEQELDSDEFFIIMRKDLSTGEMFGLVDEDADQAFRTYPFAIYSSEDEAIERAKKYLKMRRMKGDNYKYFVMGVSTIVEAHVDEPDDFVE